MNSCVNSFSFVFIVCNLIQIKCLFVIKNFGYKQSVKGSGNSAFLQKDQLCYLKRAEKLTICIYFSKLLPFLLMLVDQVKS